MSRKTYLCRRRYRVVRCRGGAEWTRRRSAGALAILALLGRLPDGSHALLGDARPRLETFVRQPTGGRPEAAVHGGPHNKCFSAPSVRSAVAQSGRRVCIRRIVSLITYESKAQDISTEFRREFLFGVYSLLRKSGQEVGDLRKFSDYINYSQLIT